MKASSKFVVMEHKAKKAGLHYDIRFKMPKGTKWISFASRKELPTKEGVRVMVTRTTDHTEKEALFTGKIESGYGAGTLKKWDEGSCTILKYELKRHIVVDFKGRKIKGMYHFLSVFKDTKAETYLLFKGKER
jgi:hypothetical protein